MRPKSRSLFWDLDPSLKLTQTNTADRQEILRFSQEKLGWGAQSRFPIWSLVFCWEGNISSCPLPTLQPLLTHSGTGWCHPPGQSYRSCQLQRRETRGLCLVCDTGTGDGHPYQRIQLPGTDRARTISAPNHSKAARKSAAELSFPVYTRGSRRAALTSAVPMSWQVFPLTRWGGHQQRAAQHPVYSKGNNSSGQGLDRCGSHSS